MPTFRTAPSADLTGSIKRLLASGGGNLTPLQEIQADTMAADTAHKSALATKVRQEVEAATQEQQIRADPARQTEFASHSAGINLDDGNRLMAHIRGALEQPGVADIEDAQLVGGTAQPFRTAAPVIDQGQDRRFRSALAASTANLLGTGKTNADQLTQATGNVQTQGITEAVQAAIGRGDYQGASAMNQGAKPGTQVKLFDNIGSTGATFAPATGTVNADPARDPSNRLLPATIDAEKAQAEQRRAAAEASRAQAEKARKEKDELGKPPAGYRWGDPDENGKPTLAPIAGGPIERLGEAQIKQLVGVQNTRNAITEYRAAIKNFGLLDMASPNAVAKMGTVYNNMMLQAKEAYNLGVLNGPDYEILQSVVADPTKLRNGVLSKSALDAQASKLDEIMKNIGVTVNAASKQRTPGAGAPAAVPPTNAKGWKLHKDAKGNQAYVSPDGTQFEEVK